MKHHQPHTPRSLAQRPIGFRARIVNFVTSTHDLSAEEQEKIQCRLLEMNLSQGKIFELVHKSPFGGYPIALQIDQGGLVGLDEREAQTLAYEELSSCQP